ncbi:MAG: hypothetical protein IJ357_03730 [Oscillospiraceae bacterium]|nr:hypothetical protein [Oscillospiraceae bacterium]
MKKSVVLTLFILALALILLIAGLCIYFFFIHDSAGEAESEASLLSVEEYAARQWPDYAADYSGGVLTLTRETGMTYEEACTLAGDIYKDELAPETYVSVVQTIAIDIAATCGVAPTVILRYSSSDGGTVFSVSSTGRIETCWSEGGAQ